jgi:hypothetical protein
MPSTLIEVTRCTARASDASRAIAARSAGVSCPDREATIVISEILPAAPPPSSGAARFAALVRRQEGAVVVVDLAAERGQNPGQDDGDSQPEQDDRVSEPHHEARVTCEQFLHELDLECQT